MTTQDQVLDTLRTIKYPGFSRDIVSFGLIKGVEVAEGSVRVKISLQTRDPAVPRTIHDQARAALESLPGVSRVELDFDLKDPPTTQGPAGPLMKQSIDGVNQVIAVASGKGGVGKSTVASNLAVALAAEGAAVGLCDCDLYGPSIALMFGTDERPMATDQNEIVPVERHGVKLMSMGLLLDDSSPVIVRGPMATRYVQQFLRQCAWGKLDYLVLDLPPGTGDIQLTIVQTVALDGAIIVTTPQEVALADARKAISMFAKVNVPITGIVENMSWFQPPGRDERYHLFGEGGGRREAARLGVPLLAEIPMDMPTREGGDVGTPIALRPASAHPVSAAFHALAARVREAVAGA